MKEDLPDRIYKDNLSNIEERNSLFLTIFNRRRYEWDIMCEKNTATSSDTFYRTLNEMRYYFYSAQE